MDDEKRLKQFAAYAAKLAGNEKSEAQLFCERLFQAFGWEGLQEAGARLESKIVIRGKGGRKTTKFADLVWGGKMLIEMKSRGAKLQNHYDQAFEYWQYSTPHPRYVVLCNFDEFWIYDFDLQLYDPVDRVKIEDIPDRYAALNFLFSDERKPIFDNDRVEVTREAADKIATVFNLLVKRGVPREKAQRFILQCVLALFSQSIGLLRKGFFLGLVEECLAGGSTSDLIGGLFYRMNNRDQDEAGRYKGVQYFNGGLFSKVAPIELNKNELLLVAAAAKENWSKVRPAIFGTLFQSSMDKQRRHAMGAHFTSEADIQRVVRPTIIRPWRERIAAAKKLEDLLAIRSDLERFQVLDPACGSGNFLYIAYRELVRVEMALVSRIRDEFRSTRPGKKEVAKATFVSVKQFHGIDADEFAVELAKVTLLLGKKLAYDEVREDPNAGQIGMEMEPPLPLDNLDENIVEDDALFCKWPPADVIIGNPPYQSKNKMQQEFSPAYLKRVRDRYPNISGLADYCVYWFRRAHDELAPGGRAGLVGTKTIRENTSREGGLGYIVQTGTITEAVSTEVWSGDADVHVSIVNWIKGEQPGRKLLSWQMGDRKDDPWQTIEVEHINAALSPKGDVTSAKKLETNAKSGACSQGQTHGHRNFLLTPDEAQELLEESFENKEVIFPFMIANDLIGRRDSSPSRYVIDFHPRDLKTASKFKGPFDRIKGILKDRQDTAAEEEERNAELHEEEPDAEGNRHHSQFLEKWWLLSWPRPALIARIEKIPRYIACGQVTKRPIFEFISPKIRPNAALIVFPLPDDYSFGILQSGIHWEWFTERCSKLTRHFRYTSNTVFDSFPWPQSPTLAQIRKVAKEAVDLRTLRRNLMKKNKWSLRDIYRSLEESPGKGPLAAAHAGLDAAVRDCYGMKANADILAFLLDLNLSLAKKEKTGIIGPGLPPNAKGLKDLVTTDCVSI